MAFSLVWKMVLPMAFKRLILVVLMLYFMHGAALAAETVLVDIGRWSHAELSQIIASAKQFDKPGERIVAISSHFLNTPYAADTLVGGPQEIEQLVINLAAFDCFTFLDVVEAMRRASDADDFPLHLRNVRYRNGEVAYTQRRHFFSDWLADGSLISDVTAEVGQGLAEMSVKQLNRRSDGKEWLPGIAVSERKILYLPTNRIDAKLLSGLQPGDYVGIFSQQAGLDVSHTGLIVKSKDGAMLRHASSRSGVQRVVDEDLLSYLQGKAGLLVYRAKP